jgi:hypothetical protein
MMQLLKQLAELIKILQADNILVGDCAWLVLLRAVLHGRSLTDLQRERKLRFC